MAELMKGHVWRDHKAKMKYPAWAEVKVDEIRCRVVVDPTTHGVTFLSYAEKPLHNLEFYAGRFAELARITGFYEFDCGFEANGNYNDSYRWVRSSRGLPEDLQFVHAQFLLYDLPTHGGTFEQRIAQRHNVHVQGLYIDLPLYQPIGQWVHSEEDVDKLFLTVREAGGEGLMVKDMQHLYQRGKRIYGWLKVKPESDADGRITAINRAVAEDGTPHNRAGSVTVELEDGSVAQPSGIAHDLASDMWAHPDKYIGQWCEFKYMERDRKGGYRHPFFYRLREAKA